MELSGFSYPGVEDSSCRDQLENQSPARGDTYDTAQDILDTCNRDLEELRMKVLKTSVHCHMLEVDLATQFNPRNQQLYADAQESCRQCTKSLDKIHLDVSKSCTTSRSLGTEAEPESEIILPAVGKQQAPAGGSAVQRMFCELQVSTCGVQDGTEKGDVMEGNNQEVDH